MIAAALLVLVACLAPVAPAHALFGGTFTANACLAGKVKCIAKTKRCLLVCHRKALRVGTPVSANCLARCRDAFAADPPDPNRPACFARLEAKGGCAASLGDAATFAAKIDADLIDVMATLNPGGDATQNPCSAGKTKCAARYDACILNAVRKALLKGTAIGDLSKCTALLDGRAASCVGKLEAKYCPGCTSNVPACRTFGDEVHLRNADDAFVDDAIAALVAGPISIDTQRCSGDTSVACTSAPGGIAGCGGALGTCEFHLGAPLPIVAASFIGLCVTSRWNGSIAGTFDEATGASAGTASVLATVYNGFTVSRPCPTCVGDAFPNDGVQGGTCSGGARNGQPCDGNGISPEPSFGVTSLDCPSTPGGLITTVGLAVDNGNTGAIAKTVGPSSPNCNGAPGKKCLCASCTLDSRVACENDAQCTAVGAGTCTSIAGEPRRPNYCNDDTSTPGDGTICQAGADGEGICPEGPTNQHCLIETFRGCSTDGDCPAENDRCAATPFECFPGYDGQVGDAVTASGFTGNARNGAAVSQFASVFCVPPTGSSFLNVAAGGLPGPGRVELLGVGESDGGPGCPTKASFLATAKRGVIDIGWNGLEHDVSAIGQAKVTVAATCTGTHPNCSCSYTGPIPN
jgi:hypothetical protein